MIVQDSSLNRYGTGSDGPIAQFWLERTPDKREVDGSSPSRPTIGNGGVAQLGERLPCTQEVIGSIPFTSTTPSAWQAFAGRHGTEDKHAVLIQVLVLEVLFVDMR